jgi:hypothetical protein
MCDHVRPVPRKGGLPPDARFGDLGRRINLITGDVDSVGIHGSGAYIGGRVSLGSDG